MRFGPLLRVLGTALYGLIGWELGVALARTPELTTESWKYIVPFTLLGAAFGFLLAPWLVFAPAKAARNALRQVPISDLVAGTIGVSAGLLIAALLSFPVSRLPAPFGNIVPLILVFMFGYLGAAVLVLRQRDFFSFLRTSGKAEEFRHQDHRCRGYAALPRYQRHHRRTHCRHRQDRLSAGHADGAALRAQRIAVHRRLGGHSAPQPRPPRAGGAGPAPEYAGSQDCLHRPGPDGRSAGG